jgi:filamentous hemagglutinin family protein
LAAALLMSPLLAQAGPVGGQVTAGSGSIAQSGTTTTVTQSSQSMSASWQSFNTARGETVNFVQPSASAVAVNRIHDTNPTQFFGQLNANGQVYLINPNGILFGAGAQVNVGGLVASTLDMSDASLASASRRFSGNGTGSIVNQGDINVASGGYVAFIGNTVSNQGNITAPSGAVMLGAGNDVTLTFADTSL